MTGVTHVKVALLTTTAIAATTMAITLEPLSVIHSQIPALIPLLWIPLSIPGGLSPDIDEPNSKASSWFRRMYIFSTPTLFILLAIAISRRMPLLVIGGAIGVLLITSAIRYISKFTQHRRETHSLLYLGCLLGVSYLLGWATYSLHSLGTLIVWNLGIGFTIGAFTHILVDGFNRKPTHWFFPLEHIFRDKKTNKLRFFIPTILKIRTGGPGEQVFNKIYPVALGFVCLAILGIFYLV